MRTRKKQSLNNHIEGKPSVKVFTKEHPCTKLDLWNAFRGKRGFIRQQVDVAYSFIGKNAPRNMLIQGYAEVVTTRNIDYLRLTGEGEEWLMKKFTRQLPQHPEWYAAVKNLPISMEAL